jgi:hypothetical protein
VVSHDADDSPIRGTPSGWRGRLCLLPTSSSFTPIILSLQPTIFEFGVRYFRSAISDCVCLTSFVGGSGTIVSRPHVSCAMRLPSTQGDLKRSAQMRVLRSASITDATNRFRRCARLTTILLQRTTLMMVNGNTPGPRFSEPVCESTFQQQALHFVHATHVYPLFESHQTHRILTSNE